MYMYIFLTFYKNCVYTESNLYVLTTVIVQNIYFLLLGCTLWFIKRSACSVYFYAWIAQSLKSRYKESEDVPYWRMDAFVARRTRACHSRKRKQNNELRCRIRMMVNMVSELRVDTLAICDWNSSLRSLAVYFGILTKRMSENVTMVKKKTVLN